MGPLITVNTVEEADKYRSRYGDYEYTVSIEILSALAHGKIIVDSTPDEYGLILNPPNVVYDTMDFCGVLCNFADECIAKAKSEARKECIEKVKTFYRENKFAYEAECICEELDNILKEMECTSNE